MGQVLHDCVMADKRQPPLWLDIDFVEAMERFGRTNRKETLEAEAATVAKKAAGVPNVPPDKPVTKPQKRRRPRKRPD